MPLNAPISLIGIPCGWMPIFDADCYPHLHPSQMQPMPAPMPQLPVQPESTHFTGHHLPSIPESSEIPEDWNMIESPSIEDELIVEQPEQPKSKPKPEANVGTYA